MNQEQVKAQVLQADELRYQALYAQDALALESMLADDYVHVHADGKIDDKTAFLSSIRSAKYRFVDAHRTEQAVRSIDSIAILHGKTKTTLDIAGKAMVMNNAFSTVWVQQAGGLKLLHWQATKMVEA